MEELQKIISEQNQEILRLKELLRRLREGDFKVFLIHAFVETCLIKVPETRCTIHIDELYNRFRRWWIEQEIFESIPKKSDFKQRFEFVTGTKISQEGCSDEYHFNDQYTSEEH